MTDGPDPLAAALAGGLSWALFTFVAGLGAMAVPSWRGLVTFLGQFYLGYAPTLAGSLIGAVWAFADLFIGLYVFLRLYVYFRENPPL